MGGSSRFMCRCPVGCADEWRETTVFLSDGSVLSCLSCGQRMSQIDESC